MSIGEYAFQGCSSLTSVTIADGVTSIGGYAFLGCSRLTSVTIPNSVTSIGVWAFDSCKSLTSITIPNNVTTIGWGAFARCSSLSSITVEDGNMYYDSRNNCNAIIDSNNQLVVGCKYSIIPNSVANIGRYAFYGCSGLTSITIPNSVTSIGSNAFQNCSSLTTIISEIENPFTIDNSVFDFPSNAQLIVPKGTEEKYKVTEGWYKLYNIDKCGDKVYYSYNSTTHTLTISGNGAMNSGFGGAEPDNRPWLSYLTDIQKIVIESGVTTIDWYAFSGCINLTSVTIPSSVTHIDDGAFNGCRGLTTVNIPYGVTSIGNDDWGGAFQGCTGLTSITIPNSVTTIGYKSFAGCTNLISITIPNSVTSIDSDAFRDCSSLESMVVESGNTKYDSRNNCNAIIETTSNTLVAGCKNTIIPNSVTAIGNFAFYGCSGLTSIAIPNSVTSIGGYAFQNCTDLTSLTIPNSVTSIDDGAFMDCKSLTLIISEIENPFVLLDGGEESSITYPFKGIPSYAQLIVPQGTKAKYQTTAGWNRFYNIVESSGKWGNNVYYYYNALTYKLTISGEGPMWNIEDYDEHPWKYLSVKMLEIEPGVTSIGDFAFTRFGMTSVTIPNSVKSIGNYSFLFCGSLASVTIPNSVSSISPGAFQGCGKLTRVVSKIENPFAIDNTVFSNISSDAKLIVPKGTIGKYKATAGWNFANIVEATGSEQGDFSDKGIYFNLKNDGSLEVIGLASWTTIADIPSSIVINGTKYRVTSIGERAFEGRSDITYLSIPYSIKSIGKYAFVDCGSSMTVNIVDPESWCQMELGNEHASPLSSAGKMLVHDIETTSFTVPETVTSIGAFTFYQCRCLESLYLPGSVKSIDSSAFEDCDYLTSLTLGEGLQSIGGSAFEGCKRLTTLTIPSTVNSMLINAFKNCSGLTSVTSEIDNPFMIDTSVFNGIPSNAQLIVPKGTKSKYQATEGWKNFTNIIEVGGLVLEGDVNGDGVVNETDAIDVATYILGKTPTGFKKDAADINKDDMVNVADIVLINKIIKKNR